MCVRVSVDGSVNARCLRSPGQMSGITPWSIDRSSASSSLAPAASGPRSSPTEAQRQGPPTPLPSNATRRIQRHAANRSHGSHIVGRTTPTAPLGQRTATKFWLGGAVIDDAGCHCWGGGTKHDGGLPTDAAAAPSKANATACRSMRHAARPLRALWSAAGARQGRKASLAPVSSPESGWARPSDRRRRAARAHPPTCDLPVCLGVGACAVVWGGCQCGVATRGVGGWIDRSVMMRIDVVLPRFFSFFATTTNTTPMNGARQQTAVAGARPTRRRGRGHQTPHRTVVMWDWGMDGGGGLGKVGRRSQDEPMPMPSCWGLLKRSHDERRDGSSSNRKEARRRVDMSTCMRSRRPTPCSSLFAFGRCEACLVIRSIEFPTCQQ